MSRPRLTKNVHAGMWELIPILDALSTCGWEGTTLECRNDDCGGPKKCDRCGEREDAEAALSWLIGIARSETARRNKKTGGK
jgi:hypothetical protein